MSRNDELRALLTRPDMIRGLDRRGPYLLEDDGKPVYLTDVILALLNRIEELERSVTPSKREESAG